MSWEREEWLLTRAGRARQAGQVSGALVEAKFLEKDPSGLFRLSCVAARRSPADLATREERAINESIPHTQSPAFFLFSPIRSFSR